MSSCIVTGDFGGTVNMYSGWMETRQSIARQNTFRRNACMEHYLLEGMEPDRGLGGTLGDGVGQQLGIHRTRRSQWGKLERNHERFLGSVRFWERDVEMK